MFQRLSQWILSLLGWHVSGFPTDIPPKYIVAAGPHTSNWDFPLGILTRTALGQKIHFLGKHTLFYPPLGWLMRWLGGYPVDRRKRGNMVDAVVDIFNHKEKFAITIAPEGTRRRVTKLKSGFYHIARKAGIPILICRFDYAQRTILFGPLFWPGQDADADLETITAFFRGVQGKYPDQGIF